MECEAKTSGGARSGDNSCRLSGEAFGQSGKAGDVSVHAGGDLGGRALLRTEDMRTALAAAERIRHITGDVEAAFLEERRHLAVIDAHDLRQITAVAFDTAAIFLIEMIAQRRQHADAGIIRRTSTDADDEVAASTGQGSTDEFAEAVGGGIHRISKSRRHKRQSGGIRHLDDSRVALREPAIAACDWLPQRPCHRDGDDVSAKTRRQHIDRPLPAVCQRKDSTESDG